MFGFHVFMGSLFVRGREGRREGTEREGEGISPQRKGRGE